MGHTAPRAVVGRTRTLRVRAQYACNANCGFCNFARDTLPKERWEYVERQGAFDAIDILFCQGIRYLVLTGGEPTLHFTVPHRPLSHIIVRAGH